MIRDRRVKRGVNKNKKSSNDVVLFEDYNRFTRDNSKDLKEKGNELISRSNDAMLFINENIALLKTELQDSKNGFYNWDNHALLTIITESLEDLASKVRKNMSKTTIKKEL